MKRKKKIPQRKCIVTNELKPKDEMIRIVRNKAGEVFVDVEGKKSGRGAYITIDKASIQQARKRNVLQQVFHTSVDYTAIYDELERIVNDQHD